MGSVYFSGSAVPRNLESNKWESLLSGFLRRLGSTSGNLSCNKWESGSEWWSLLWVGKGRFRKRLAVKGRFSLREEGSRRFEGGFRFDYTRGERQRLSRKQSATRPSQKANPRRMGHPQRGCASEIKSLGHPATSSRATGPPWGLPPLGLKSISGHLSGLIQTLNEGIRSKPTGAPSSRCRQAACQSYPLFFVGLRRFRSGADCAFFRMFSAPAGDSPQCAACYVSCLRHLFTARHKRRMPP